MKIKSEDPLFLENEEQTANFDSFTDIGNVEEFLDDIKEEEIIQTISVVKMTDDMILNRRERCDKGKKRERKGEYTKFDYVERKDSKEPTSKKTCFLCGEVIVGLKNFEVHKRDKHRMSANSKRLECPTCKKMFSREIIKSHIFSKHYGVKRIPCPFCRTLFTEEEDL